MTNATLPAAEPWDPDCMDAAFYLELAAAVATAFADGRDGLECAPTLRSGQPPAP